MIDIDERLSIKQYLTNRVEFALFCLVFIMIFFQLFPLYHGKLFFVTYYFPVIIFVIYVCIQLLGFEKFNFNKDILLIYFFFTCWLLYGLLSVYFNINHEDALVHIRMRFEHFFCFYVITQFLTTEKRIKVFEKMVLFNIIWNLGVSIWEITTLQHLPTSKYFERIHYVPTGAFPNENDLPSAMLICLPMLFFMRDKFWRYVCISVLVVFFFVIIAHGTRTIIATSFPFIFYLFIKKTSSLYKTIIFTILISALFLFLNSDTTLKLMVKGHIDTRVINPAIEFHSQRLSSGTIRSYMYKISFEKFVESKGLGIGIGNFERHFSPPYQISTGGNQFAHNLFAEILTNEGIIGFTLLCLIVFSILPPILSDKNKKSILDVFNSSNFKEDEKRVLIFLFFFVISVAVPATVRHYFIYWSILGYNYAIIFNRAAQRCETSAMNLADSTPLLESSKMTLTSYNIYN